MLGGKGMNQGRSQDFGSGGGREGQTKFSVMSQKFRFEAVTFSKNLINKDFKKNLKIYIKIAQNL